MGLHVLVAMPCGRKQDVDFDAVYAEYLQPALESAGFEILRADDRPDTFREALLADLIVIDQTVDTPEWRSDVETLITLRADAVLRVQGSTSLLLPAGNAAQTLRFHVTEGRPSPLRVQADRQTLARAALAAIALPRSGAPSATPDGRAASHEEASWHPRRVFLFSGHMMDTPDRAIPRFPPLKEQVAAAAIAGKLDALEMGEHDLALCGGACGGDLLFAEAALRRNCRTHLYLQFNEADFLRASVAFAGASWADRYFAVKAHPLTRLHIQPDELGVPPDGINPYVRNNLWQLFTALAHGADRLWFLALWDGEDTAGAGGTRNMVETVRRHAGRVCILDTRRLFGF